MAALKEAVGDARASGDELCLVVSAGDPKTHRRIEAALAEHDLNPMLRVNAPEELFELDIDPAAVIVAICSVDLPKDVTNLRRLRRELREPAIVAISQPTTGIGVRRALDAGADAVVFEPELETTLALAINAVASGQSVVPRKVRAGVERPTLSHRERQVLAFVSNGLTNAQIAERLFLSESTIKSHLSSAFAKFGVRSRREAAALFLDLEQRVRTT